MSVLKFKDPTTNEWKEIITIQGPPGEKGADGTMTFEDLTEEQREQLRGPQGIQGPQGDIGPIGPEGPQGEPGHTPERGVDYWTEEDKAEIIASIPSGGGGSNVMELFTGVVPTEEQLVILRSFYDNDFDGTQLPCPITVNGFPVIGYNITGSLGWGASLILFTSGYTNRYTVAGYALAFYGYEVEFNSTKAEPVGSRFLVKTDGRDIVFSSTYDLPGGKTTLLQELKYLNDVKLEADALTDYATTTYVDNAISTIELTPGPEGPKGDKGDQGLQGPIGATGPEGPQGIQGPIGLTGPEGPQGVQGIQGIQGEQGPKGDKGDKGDTGEVGPEGPAGKDGKDGEDYVLTDADKQQIAGMVVIPAPDVDLSNYYTKSETNALIPNVSGFITMSAVEAKGYQTASDVETAISNALSAIGVAEEGVY